MTKEYLSNLNEQQKEAVIYPFDKPLFICASAGSGKTRTLICRIAHMIDSNIQPESILSLTFTRKAADEIKERLRAFVGPKAEKVVTSTFHQFCLTMIKENPFILGFKSRDKDKEFHIADNAAQRCIIKKTINALKARSTERKKELSNPTIIRQFTTRLLNFVNRAKMFEKDPSMFGCDGPFILNHYNEQLKKRRLIDFNDFMTLARDLLSKHQKIAHKYKERFKYILIDEFQDTSDLNFTVLKLLLSQSMSNSPPNQCITIVGDPHQSIYGFRGANPDNIDHFKALYPNSKEILLNKNYRTSESIILASNSLISHDTCLKTASYEVEPMIKGGLITKYITAPDAYSEADSICTEIERLVYPGSEFHYRDITIMFRMRKASAEIEMELFRRAIPYTHKRGTSFYMRNEVREIISYCRLFLNYGSKERDKNMMLLSCFEMVINVPNRQIKQSVVSQLIDESEERNVNIMQHLSDVVSYKYESEAKPYPKATLKKLNDFYILIGKLYYQICIVNQSMSTDTIIEMILQLTQMSKTNENDDETDSINNSDDKTTNTNALDDLYEQFNDDLNNRTETITLLIEEARRFHLRLMQTQKEDSPLITSDVNIRKFIDSITLELTGDFKKNAVTLSTIHQMKGLECPICFIIRFNEGIIPMQNNESKSDSVFLEQEVSIEEERRIAYVAITRAKSRLFISCALSFRGKEIKPSRFINEIGMENMTKNIDLTIEEKRELDSILEYDSDSSFLSFDDDIQRSSQQIFV